MTYRSAQVLSHGPTRCNDWRTNTQLHQASPGSLSASATPAGPPAAAAGGALQTYTYACNTREATLQGQGDEGKAWAGVDPTQRLCWCAQQQTNKEALGHRNKAGMVWMCQPAWDPSWGDAAGRQLHSGKRPPSNRPALGQWGAAVCVQAIEGGHLIPWPINHTNTRQQLLLPRALRWEQPGQPATTQTHTHTPATGQGQATQRSSCGAACAAQHTHRHATPPLLHCAARCWARATCPQRVPPRGLALCLHHRLRPAGR